MNRHDMLFIDKDCRKYAAAAAIDLNPRLSANIVNEVILSPIPAIVKMQEDHKLLEDGLLEVGFSSYLRVDESRVRVKSVIPVAGIKKIITPYDVLSLYDNLAHAHIRNALAEIASLPFAVGIYGSCALQILTSLPYITPSSDIDICLTLPCDYGSFFVQAKEIAERYQVKFDIEAITTNGDGVKLMELVSVSGNPKKQRTVLAKGLYKAGLIAI